MKKFLYSLVLSMVLPFLCYSQTYTLKEKWVDCGNSCQLLDPYYSEGVTFEWTGESKNGKAHGFGKAVKYKNGKYESTYEGEYKNGIREGKGTFTHSDGSIKKGVFINGQLTGYGTMELENGDSYEGNFINYRCHGKGKVTWGNGSIFEGYMVTDAPYTGKITYYDGTIVFIQKGQPVEKISERKSNYSPKLGVRQREYFDKDWNRCQAKDAAYYRLVTYEAPNRPKGTVKDYYISGELQGECTFVFIDYDDEGKNFNEGEMILYHKNGKIEEKITYFNNQPNGPYVEYYESGSVKMEHFYKLGVLDGNSISYYENGKPYTVAQYNNGVLKNNKFLRFQENGTCFLVYDENFARNSETWEYKGQNGTVGVFDGESVVLAPSPGRTISGGIDTGFSQDCENVIEFIVSQNSAKDSSVGILFGFEDWDNYCAIYILGNSYLFRCLKGGQKMTEEEWIQSSAIKNDVNQIDIANTRQGLIIDINGESVWQSQSIKYSGTFCGITADNNTDGEAYVNALGLTVYELVENEDIIKEYMPTEQSGNENDWKSSGSGFFVDSRGYIATNYHVIEDARQIEISFVRNGEWEHYPASVVLSDKQNDLSILKIESTSFKTLGNIPYNFTTNIKDTGSEVFTLGYPIASVMGDEVKFTDGKISSKTGIQGDVTVYQISVPIQPGNSGGPLLIVAVILSE